MSNEVIRATFERESRSWELNKFDTFNRYLRAQAGSIYLVAGFMGRRLLTIEMVLLETY